MVVSKYSTLWESDALHVHPRVQGQAVRQAASREAEDGLCSCTRCTHAQPRRQYLPFVQSAGCGDGGTVVRRCACVAASANRKAKTTHTRGRGDQALHTRMHHPHPSPHVPTRVLRVSYCICISAASIVHAPIIQPSDPLALPRSASNPHFRSASDPLQSNSGPILVQLWPAV